MFPKAKQISAGIVCNYRKDVGCPETYRDLVRVLHARYLPSMKDWPIEKLSTVTSGSMYLQMQPEHSVPAVFCISNQKPACAVKAYSEFRPVSLVASPEFCIPISIATAFFLGRSILNRTPIR